MFVCDDCGRAYEDYIARRCDYICRRCGGNLEEAEECAVCGKLHIAEELIEGVCEDCIDKCRDDVEMCLEVGEEDKQSVKINGFLAFLFDESDITTILTEYVKERMPDVDCGEYIDNDKYWFASKLKETR